MTDRQFMLKTIKSYQRRLKVQQYGRTNLSLFKAYLGYDGLAKGNANRVYLGNMMSIASYFLLEKYKETIKNFISYTSFNNLNRLLSRIDKANDVSPDKSSKYIAFLPQTEEKRIIAESVCKEFENVYKNELEYVKTGKKNSAKIIIE